MTTPEDREIWERDEEALRDEVRQLSATLDRASRDAVTEAREYRALVAERDELRAEVERLRGQSTPIIRTLARRAREAEAKLARVEALLSVQQERHTEDGDGRCQWCDAPLDECDIVILRAALADAPAEQRAEGGA
jgi:chromosome segregation ATPase